MTLFCLALLNGILEDDRNRLQKYFAVNEAFKLKVDVIQVLWNFIEGQSVTQQVDHAQLAAHTLAIFIQGYDKFSVQQAEDSLKFL